MNTNWINITIVLFLFLISSSCSSQKDETSKELKSYLEKVAPAVTLDNIYAVFIGSPEGCHGCLSRLYYDATCKNKEGRIFILAKTDFTKYCDEEKYSNALIIDTSSTFKTNKMHQGSIVLYLKQDSSNFISINVTPSNVDSLLNL